MNLVLVGAGAIGTLYAVKLAARCPVTVITRDGGTSEMRRLRVVGLGDQQAEIRFAPPVEALEPNTLVLVTTKAYDAAVATQGVLPVLRPDSTVVCLQNGLRVEDDVREVVGDRAPVIRAITYFGALLEAPGTVSLRAQGHTSFEPSSGSDAIAAVFSSCGLDGRVASDIQKEVWQKTIANAVINPLTAMTGMDVGWVADERLDRLKRAIIAECVAVANHEGIRFEGDLTQLLNLTFGASRNLSSMHQDLVKGRRTEIDYLNGAVVRLGQRYGIDCPINTALASIVRELERAANRAGRNPVTVDG